VRAEVLEFIRINNRITAKDIAEALSVSLRQGERIMAVFFKISKRIKTISFSFCIGTKF